MGDVNFEPGYLEAMLEAVEAHADHVLEAGARMRSFGGDHLVSRPLLRAHARRHGPLRLVHFAAHSDTWLEDGGLLHEGLSVGARVVDRPRL